MIADLVLRWVHVLGAIVLVGGSIFMRYPYLSVIQAQQPPSSLLGEVRRRWSVLVMAASGLLLISGLINFVLVIQRFEIVGDSFPGNIYHMVFGIKFLLALAVFFLASALAGRSALAERLRRRERAWLTLNVALAVAVVLLGGILKLAPRAEKTAVSPRFARSIVARHVLHDPRDGQDR